MIKKYSSAEFNEDKNSFVKFQIIGKETLYGHFPFIPL